MHKLLLTYKQHQQSFIKFWSLDPKLWEGFKQQTNRLHDHCYHIVTDENCLSGTKNKIIMAEWHTVEPRSNGFQGRCRNKEVGFLVFETPPRFLTSKKKTIFDGAEIFTVWWPCPGAALCKISSKSAQWFRIYKRPKLTCVRRNRFLVFETPPRFLTSKKKTISDGAEIFTGCWACPGVALCEISSMWAQ